MESEGSSPCLQEPGTDSCQRKLTLIHIFKSHFLWSILILSYLCLGLPSDLFPSSVPTKILCTFLLSPMRVVVFDVASWYDSRNCTLLIIWVSKGLLAIVSLMFCIWMLERNLSAALVANSTGHRLSRGCGHATNFLGLSEDVFSK
jgi:hypothetical protein